MTDDFVVLSFERKGKAPEITKMAEVRTYVTVSQRVTISVDLMHDFTMKRESNNWYSIEVLPFDECSVNSSSLHVGYKSCCRRVPRTI